MRSRARIQHLLVLAGIIACGEPTQPDLPVVATRNLAVGQVAACALDRQGETSCWGENNGFQDTDNNPSFFPQFAAPVKAAVPRLASLTYGASLHMCGITMDKAITCWGRGGWGQLARGVLEPAFNSPATINLAASWEGVTIGRITTCGWTADGTGYCWGMDQYGELGDPAIPRQTRVTTPNPVAGGIKFSSVVAGWQHSCGISTAGAAYCWGRNTSGQLGIGAIDQLDHPTPLLVSPEIRFKKLSLGMRSTCGIASDNRLYCWGYNATGQLGDGTTTQREMPTPVASSLRFIDVSVGTADTYGAIQPAGLEQGGVAHACGVAEDGTAWCWGWNGAGQLGDGTLELRTSPRRVSGDTKFTSIGAGGAFTCATGESAVWCWGANYLRQLGNGTTLDSSLPVQVTLAWP